VLGSAEAIDGADFERDDDGQDDTHAGKSLGELHGGAELDALPDPCFQLIDLLLDQLEQFELLVHAAAGLFRQCVDELEQRRPPFGGEDIAGGVQGKSILGQGGMHAVLPEGHRDDVSAARDLEKAIRVRGSSRASRTSLGGIQTEGSFPR
jgi:hypothetical protein